MPLSFENGPLRAYQAISDLAGRATQRVGIGFGRRLSLSWNRRAIWLTNRSADEARALLTLYARKATDEALTEIAKALRTRRN